MYNYFYNKGPSVKIRIPMDSSSGQKTICSLVSYCSTRGELGIGFTLSVLFEGNNGGNRVLYYVQSSQSLGVKLQKK